MFTDTHSHSLTQPQSLNLSPWFTTWATVMVNLLLSKLLEHSLHRTRNDCIKLFKPNACPWDWLPVAVFTINDKTNSFHVWTHSVCFVGIWYGIKTSASFLSFCTPISFPHGHFYLSTQSVSPLQKFAFSQTISMSIDVFLFHLLLALKCMNAGSSLDLLVQMFFVSLTVGSITADHFCGLAYWLAIRTIPLQ